MTTPSVSRVSLGNNFYRYHSELPQEVGTASQGSSAGYVDVEVPFQDETGVIGLVPTGVTASMVKVSKITGGIQSAYLYGGGSLLISVEPANEDGSFWHPIFRINEPEQNRSEDFIPPTRVLAAHMICFLHLWQAHSAGMTPPWGNSTSRSASISIEYEIVPT